MYNKSMWISSRQNKETNKYHILLEKKIATQNRPCTRPRQGLHNRARPSRNMPRIFATLCYRLVSLVYRLLRTRTVSMSMLK